MMTGKTYRYEHDAPIDHPPATVVSLVPSITESLFDLNLGNRLVAVTDYCIYPADGVAGLPRIGGTKNPDIERIIALKPELVIANQEENRRQDVEALQSAGIPVWVTFPKTVQDVLNLLWGIMYLFEETSMVPRVRLIEQQYDWIMGISSANEDRAPKVFVPIWLDPLMTFNRDTYMHDLLTVCGGKNVFADRERRFPLAADLGEARPYPDDAPRVRGRDRRYPRLSWEELEAVQPDVILLPTEPYEFTVDHIALFAKLDIPATHNQRIHIVDGTLLTWHGTRLTYALDRIPPLLQPVDQL